MNGHFSTDKLLGQADVHTVGQVAYHSGRSPWRAGSFSSAECATPPSRWWSPQRFSCAHCRSIFFSTCILKGLEAVVHGGFERERNENRCVLWRWSSGKRRPRAAFLQIIVVESWYEVRFQYVGRVWRNFLLLSWRGVVQQPIINRLYLLWVAWQLAALPSLLSSLPDTISL